MAPLVALHRQTVPPSGHSLAVSCSLQLATRLDLVTARNNALHVYSVEGTKLVHRATRQLHGRVTALARVKTLATAQDGRDRLLVAVHHAKMTLMEWDPQQHDLVPVSLHTYEKLPQVDDEREARLAVDPASRLVAYLLPTNSGGDATLALLPLFAAADDDLDDEDPTLRDGIPYAPSHLVPLASLTQPAATATTNALLPQQTPPIRNVVSIAFLPGFTEPTLAVLYCPDWTWAGRLEYLAHNFLVSLVTLSSQADKGTTRAVVISTSPALPYSCLALHPCPVALGGSAGGVLVTTANGLLYVDPQSGRVVATPVNGWLARDYPPGKPKPAGLTLNADSQTTTLRERLEGSQVEFYTHPTDSEQDDQSGTTTPPPRALVWCRDGTVLDLSFTLTGRTVSSLHLEPVAQAGPLTGGGAATLIRLPSTTLRSGLVFVGSETGSSALMRWSLPEAAGAATAAADQHKASRIAEQFQARETASMDVDEDGESKPLFTPFFFLFSLAYPCDLLSLSHPRHADIYGDTTTKETTQAPTFDPSALASLASVLSAQNATPSSSGAAATTKVQLEVCDTLPGYGAIRNMTTGLIDDEVSRAALGWLS